MARKTQETSTDEQTGSQTSAAIKDSAQQIWLAGLGAFSKAQEEGGKVFENLVKEGLSIQRKSQAVAEEKISEATSRMASMATDLQSKAGYQWGKLENIFEERVAKALNKLGVPSAKDVDALAARVEELSKTVARMSGKTAAAKSSGTSTAKPVASKADAAPTKRAPKRAQSSKAV